MSNSQKLIEKVVSDQMEAIRLHKLNKPLPSGKDKELRKDWRKILKLGLQSKVYQIISD
jgi:hypothetical protein